MLRRLCLFCVIAASAVSAPPSQARLVEDFTRLPAIKESNPSPNSFDGRFVALPGGVLAVVSHSRSERSLVYRDLARRRNTVLFSSLPWDSYETKIIRLGKSQALIANADRYDDSLWVTDGTPRGTKAFVNGLDVESMYAFGDQVLLVAKTQALGRELWITDGSAKGTMLVRDFTPGAASSRLSIRHAEAPRNRAFVVGPGTKTTPTLYVTDGTPSGTKALHPNLDVPLELPRLFVRIGNGKTLFFGSDGVHGLEPWITDGTAQGTKMLVDIASGSASCRPSRPAFLRGRAIFRATDGQSASLWISDGSSAGTVPTIPLRFDGLHTFHDPVAFGSQVYFRGRRAAEGYELFRTDGTRQGTKIVSDLWPGSVSGAPRDFLAAGNKLYFSASHKDAGQELHVFDGFTTKLVADLNPGTKSSQIRGCALTATGQIVFSALEPNLGRELWAVDTKSDRSELHDLYDVPNATEDTYIGTLQSIGERLLYTAGDRSHLHFGSVDSSASSMNSLVKLGSIWQASSLHNVVPLGAHALVSYQPDLSSAAKIWISDGTPAGTRLSLQNYRGWLSKLTRHPLDYGYAASATGTSLGLTNGTQGGALHLTDGQWTSVSTANAEGIFIFAKYGDGLWRSDGTAKGTQRFARECAGTCPSSPSEFTPYGSRWVFSAKTAAAGNELWITDGTARGTRLLRDIMPGARGSEPRGFTVLDRRVYFSCTTDKAGRELWSTDGTSAGTRLVVDLIPGSGHGAPTSLTAVGKRHLYFAAWHKKLGDELFVFDVRTQQARIAADIHRGIGSSCPRATSKFPVVASKLFMAADDGIHGNELWSYDNGATASQLGRSCDRITLECSTDPVLGTTLQLHGSSASVRPHALYIGVPDYSNTRISQHGGRTCRSYLRFDPAPVLVCTMMGPTWSAPIRIPANPRLLGARVALQSFSLSQAQHMTVVSSNALDWTLGR